MLGELGVRRERDDRDGTGRGVGFEEPIRLPPVDAELSEVEVQEDQVRAFRGREGQAGMPIGGVDHLVEAVLLEPAADQLRDIGLVLNI